MRKFAVAFSGTSNIISTSGQTKQTIFLEIVEAENVDEAIGRAFRKIHCEDYLIGAFRAMNLPLDEVKDAKLS